MNERSRNFITAFLLMFACLTIVSFWYIIGGFSYIEATPKPITNSYVHVNDTPDPLVSEAHRLGQSLINCRDKRRDELCRYASKKCAATATFSYNGTSELATGCDFDCQTGYLYTAGLESVFNRVKATNNDRRQQIKILWVELAGCASGRDLVSTGLEFEVMDIK